MLSVEAARNGKFSRSKPNQGRPNAASFFFACSKVQHQGAELMKIPTASNVADSPPLAVIKLVNRYWRRRNPAGMSAVC
jgi:hypothetical protein